jgi:hypothetical protein
LGDEVVETARHAGTLVKAVARTSGGFGVAAAFPPRGSNALTGLGAEIDGLRRGLGARVETIVYRNTAKGDTPLVPERLSAGALA